MTMTTTNSFIPHFPFSTLRANQEYVLRQIEMAFTQGFKYIILDAPVGFGKSPVAVASAMALGSSHILTSTKNLQTQYHNDFKWVLTAKGRGNFQCPILVEDKDSIHHTADHAPCLDKDYKCPLKTKLKDYYTKNTGTRNEVVMLDESGSRLFEDDLCDYYDQRNRALTSSHSVLNYPLLLSLMGLFEERKLLVLDEAHELPTEVLKFQSLTITKYRWREYLVI